MKTKKEIKKEIEQLYADLKVITKIAKRQDTKNLWETRGMVIGRISAFEDMLNPK